MTAPRLCTQLHKFWMTTSPITNFIRTDGLFSQKSINTMPVMLCMGTTYVKKNSCIVATIASFDTEALDLLTFHILDPYSFKDIEFDLSHAISH